CWRMRMSSTMRLTRGSIFWTVLRLYATSGVSGTPVARSPLELFMVVPPHLGGRGGSPLLLSYVGFQVGASGEKQDLHRAGRACAAHPRVSGSLGQRPNLAKVEKSTMLS